MTDATEIAGNIQDQPEVLKSFIATPERVSQYLELKAEEVTAQMQHSEGRKALFDQLMEHEEALRTDHADFQPEVVRTQMEAVGESLAAKQRYIEDVSSPEKKGIFRRAWESIKSFPKKHPVITTALALAAVAGGVAAGFYFTGNLEMLLSSVGLEHLWGAKGAGAAAETMGEIIDGAAEVPDYFEGPGGGDML